LKRNWNLLKLVGSLKWHRLSLKPCKPTRSLHDAGINGGRTMDAARPRKQQLSISTKALAEPVFAVVRVSWFKNGRECDVDEVQLDAGIDNVEAVLETVIKNALEAGADVSVITTAAASQFAVDQ
jgi:hypothetical protein